MENINNKASAIRLAYNKRFITEATICPCWCLTPSQETASHTELTKETQVNDNKQDVKSVSCSEIRM